MSNIIVDIATSEYLGEKNSKELQAIYENLSKILNKRMFEERGPASMRSILNWILLLKLTESTSQVSMLRSRNGRNTSEPKCPKFGSNNQAAIRNLEVQLGQLASVVKENAIGKLPSNTERNPKDQVHAVTLSSGKQLPEVEKANTDEKENKEDNELQSKTEDSLKK
ncbi:hypothetical protein M9H77_23807 [Catharanthus roseus]|uniref:Uncharacterized protein n=1 Tax=Catharanthus roseus TaxID=4058 RepID=A0ACC0AWH9_CATRO|nr:hypothetical protein M9H77_23807 [Catharanthus roseus]